MLARPSQAPLLSDLLALIKGYRSLPFGQSREVERGDGHGCRDIQRLHIAAEGDGKSSSGLGADLRGQTSAFIPDRERQLLRRLANLVDRNGLASSRFCGEDLTALLEQTGQPLLLRVR